MTFINGKNYVGVTAQPATVIVSVGEDCVPEFYTLPDDEQRRLIKESTANYLGRQLETTSFKRSMNGDVLVLRQQFLDAHVVVDIDTMSKARSTGGKANLQFIGVLISGAALLLAIAVAIRHWYGA